MISFIWLIHGMITGPTPLYLSGPRSNVTEGVLHMEPHYQMQFSVIHKTMRYGNISKQSKAFMRYK